MFNSKTVLVVGAGASKEVNLPIGSELTGQISAAVNFEVALGLTGGDAMLRKVLVNLYGSDLMRFVSACKRIRAGISIAASIDDYVDTHSEDADIVKCGKLALARCILAAEADSNQLRIDPSHIDNTIDFEALSNTWYVGLFRLLYPGRPKKNVEVLFDNLTIISFNYDRCIERFMAYAIRQHYHVTQSEAEHLVHTKLRILHPYGYVGPLYADKDVVPFGSNALPQAEKVFQGIKTYTEQVSEVTLINDIHVAIEQARVVIFLGNAYHENNLKILLSGAEMEHAKSIYATRKGIHDTDMNTLRQRLLRFQGRYTSAMPINFSHECHDIFSDYRLSLRQT